MGFQGDRKVSPLIYLILKNFSRDCHGMLKRGEEETCSTRKWWYCDYIGLDAHLY